MTKISQVGLNETFEDAIIDLVRFKDSIGRHKNVIIVSERHVMKALILTIEKILYSRKTCKYCYLVLLMQLC